MKYARVNGIRQVAVPKARGACCCCGEPTIAKCGSKLVWHWAHHRRRKCDAWWENETEWHRAWKSCFPEPWQETIHFDTATGEKHIADVKTDSGLVIELQNSPISLEEMRSRESFYDAMVWVVNGEAFGEQFFILGELPDPNSELAQDVRFCRQRVDWDGRGFWRRSENPGKGGLVLMHNVNEIADEIQQVYVGHHLFDWVRPRSVWFEADKPVYFDFGNGNLWQLLQYDDRGLMCVQRLDKCVLVELLGGTPSKDLIGASNRLKPRSQLSPGRSA